MIKNVKFGKNVEIWHFVNLYDCEIGHYTKIGSYVEIGRAKIGKNCKIEPFAYIPPGVIIEDDVFVGPHACFTNDKYPRAATQDGRMKTKENWVAEETVVKKGASIGANATILSGITIGEYAVVGAGAVVTKDVEAGKIVVGNPARVIKDINEIE